MGGGPFGLGNLLSSAMSDMTPPDLPTMAPPGGGGGGDMGGPPGGLPTSPTGDPSAPPTKMQQALQLMTALAKGPGKMMGALTGRGGGSPYVHPGQPGTQVPGGAPATMMGRSGPPPIGTAPGAGMTPPTGQVPPRPGYSPTGTEGEFMSQLTPKAAGIYQGLQGLQKAISDNKARKDQADAAEASNVATNLMKALDVASTSQDPVAKGEAMQTVDMILKNKEYEKVLNKVYKGWLQKADQQQKQKGKQKEVDPETAGFEAGLQKWAQTKQGQPPQMPASLRGYRLPGGGPGQQMQAMQQQALMQEMQRDPKVAAYGPEGALKLQEMQTRLQEAQEGVKTAQEHTKEAQMGVQKSQLEYDTARALGPVKEKEWETKLKEEQLKVQETQLNLDKANALLEIARQRLANPKEPGRDSYTKIRGLADVSRTIDSLLQAPPSWRIGSAPQQLRDLAGQLRIYGLSGAAARIPTGPSNFFVDTKAILEGIKGDVDGYRENYIRGLQDQYKTWTPPGESPRPTPPPAGGGGTVDTKNWKPYSGEAQPPDVVWQAKPSGATQMAPAGGKWYWVNDQGTAIAPVTAPPSGGK